eukprot:Nitzschia sp. Nitz4//scaffold14_size191712//95806//98199//NITZ4_001724-RA/size191712-processed-gene-0.275-mRNA-1//1//CDS//3329536930//1695//frame0
MNRLVCHANAQAILQRLILCSTRRPAARSLSSTVSPISNEFWKNLNQAVVQGDGFQAESIVNDLLKSHLDSFPDDSTSIPPMDARIFSLVLEAWKGTHSSQAPQRAQHLLEQMIDMHEEGILKNSPSEQDYHSVLECWAFHSNSSVVSIQGADALLHLVDRMSDEYHLTHYTASLLLAILANGGHVDKAKQFLEAIPTDGTTNAATTTATVTPTLELYNHILKAHVNSTNPHAAQEATALLMEMNKDVTMPEPDGVSYDLVLQAWARTDSSLDKVAARYGQLLLDQMKADKIPTTLVSYKSVISIWARQGEAKRAELLLTQLVKDYGDQFDAQLKPTLEPFQTVLAAYCKSFEPDAAANAESLLTHMRELYQSELLDNQPDTLAYNCVLHCWMHSKRPDAPRRATALLDHMKTDGISPDIITLNSILNALANRSDPVTAEEYLGRFYQQYLEDPLHNPQLDVVSFGTVIKAWAKSKDPNASQRAEALLLKLRKLHESGWEGCQPDNAVYSGVMKCYARSRDKDAPHKAEQLLRTMIENARDGHGAPPDAICWNIVIDAWGKAGQGEKAEALFDEMLQNYLNGNAHAAAPNCITFTAVLSGWAKTRFRPDAPDRAEAILHLMKQLHDDGRLPDAKPNVISYSTVLDCLAYAKSSDAARKAETILRDMQADGDDDIQPNIMSYNSVIKAWSLSRDPTAVSKVTTLLKELLSATEDGNRKLTPNANTFGSVLKALGDSQFPDKEKRAQAVVKLMQKFNVEWNDWSRRQLQRCSQSGGGGSRGRRQRKTAIPDVPELGYTT